ncbi:MAG: F0F1 ATP synthase subunit delta, partial [Clostridiales bacterium]|nr:F0F1 ATP synthase subunit delta [Clostridiales bacterium]
MSVVIQVSSAAELSAEQKRKIQDVFSSKHRGEKIEFVYSIDKELIGGILVVDGDKYYDGTLRSQIDNIG